AFPVWQESAAGTQSESHGSVRHSVRAEARRSGNDVSRVHLEDEHNAASGDDRGRCVGRRKLTSTRRTRSAISRVMAAWLAAASLALVGSGERVYTQASQNRAAQNQNRTASTAWPPKSSAPPPGEVEVLPVQGNVYMIAGAGGNTTV